MNKNIQAKPGRIALKLANRFGVEYENKPKFFKRYESYSSTVSELKEAYKHQQWLSNMMPIDGPTYPPALIRYSEYSFHMEQANNKVEKLEAKMSRIIKSLIKVVDFEKIIYDAAKALRPSQPKVT